MLALSLSSLPRFPRRPSNPPPTSPITHTSSPPPRVPCACTGRSRCRSGWRAGAAGPGAAAAAWGAGGAGRRRGGLGGRPRPGCCCALPGVSAGRGGDSCPGGARARHRAGLCALLARAPRRAAPLHYPTATPHSPSTPARPHPRPWPLPASACRLWTCACALEALSPPPPRPWCGPPVQASSSSSLRAPDPEYPFAVRNSVRDVEAQFNEVRDRGEGGREGEGASPGHKALARPNSPLAVCNVTNQRQSSVGSSTPPPACPHRPIRPW